MKTFAKNSLAIIIYLCSALVLTVLFWTSFNYEPAAYTIMTFWIVMPILSIAISIYYGLRTSLKKYLIILLCTFVTLLIYILTLYLNNSISFDRFTIPSFGQAIYGLVPSIIGMVIGHLISEFDSKKSFNK